MLVTLVMILALVFVRPWLSSGWVGLGLCKAALAISLMWVALGLLVQELHLASSMFLAFLDLVRLAGVG